MSKLLDIAADLELAPVQVSGLRLVAPAAWKETNLFKLFISHLAKDKRLAIRLKGALSAFSISGFVAHEDIHPTLGWQREIERALHAMDAFVAIHTEGFSQSYWTQQEIGFAYGKGAKIVSIRMGEDPTGFISKHQAISRSQKTAEVVAKEIEQLLLGDELTCNKLMACQQGSRSSDDDIPF